MIPPSYAKSLSVKNTAAHSIKVTVTFGSDAQEAEGNAKIVETREVAAHADATFEEKEYDMGEWTAVAALYSVDVEPVGTVSNSAAKTSFKPQVSGIVDVLSVEIKPHASTGALQVTAV